MYLFCDHFNSAIVAESELITITSKYSANDIVVPEQSEFAVIPCGNVFYNIVSSPVIPRGNEAFILDHDRINHVFLFSRVSR